MISDGGSWGRWGHDDERGALNLLTPAAVSGALRSATGGRVYGLGLPIDGGSAPIVPGRNVPQRLTHTSSSDVDRFEEHGARPGVGGNQDVLVVSSHHGTHIDALCHTFADGLMYNGFPASTFRTHTGAAHLGIEKVGPIVGRGVVLDVAGHLGIDRLPDGHVVTGADLEACARDHDVAVRPGDILLVRTGWLGDWRRRAVDGVPPRSGQPGLGVDAVSFVRDHDVAVVGADNSAVEAIPFDGTFIAVHIELLVKLGVPLIEHVVLDELAADGVRECLFVAAPLPVTGAAGSPVNPVAIA